MTGTDKWPLYHKEKKDKKEAEESIKVRVEGLFF